MNLANRLDALAHQKAGLETAEEFEDELHQADPPIRQTTRGRNPIGLVAMVAPFQDQY